MLIIFIVILLTYKMCFKSKHVSESKLKSILIDIENNSNLAKHNIITKEEANDQNKKLLKYEINKW
jgi:hypothetical protein